MNNQERYNSMKSISIEEAIREIVKAHVQAYAEGFQARHEGEYDNPDGTINMKIHNVFIKALGDEIRYYTALVRSLDSSLGNMLEKMAIQIAELNFKVFRKVSGPLSNNQTNFIAGLLEKYKRHEKKPSINDYQSLRKRPEKGTLLTKRHESDYYLIDSDTDTHYLIELKIGGDLDNKKARSEKEALLEQFAILSNTLQEGKKIKLYFATAYNRYGEGKPWNQQRVKQFFAEEELLIGKDFWNFICKSKKGYKIVLTEYEKNAHFIRKALNSIKRKYLG
ncbi:MAG TPA: TdeIII family type II restriction endonuclease [candidate division WOR-3 bacterium]|uniref:type II site-specific deoxyribonuclease n=1 Tax=candidate division WOR-3 bacterium TaxID=2052148 RepID=A0A9C9K0B6_UNCW3|nr:TdeIII family type II restriction endonuclease [candidate division WOR-3 bacterium]